MFETGSTFPRCNKKSLTLLVPLVILILTSSIGCESALDSKAQLETILQSSPSCAAPCWQNIVPGVSTERDLETAIEVSPANRFDQLRKNDLSPRGIQYIWDDQMTDLTSYLEVYTSTVAFISFRFRDDLTLGNALESLGKPDAYTARLVPGEAYMLDIYLFFQTGVVINVRIVPYNPPALAQPPICEVTVTEEMPVRELFLVEPGSTEALTGILSNVMANHDNPQSWPGLGNIELTWCPG